jgi:hypothetical protein
MKRRGDIENKAAVIKAIFQKKEIFNRLWYDASLSSPHIPVYRSVSLSIFHSCSSHESVKRMLCYTYTPCVLNLCLKGEIFHIFTLPVSLVERDVNGIRTFFNTCMYIFQQRAKIN